MRTKEIRELSTEEIRQRIKEEKEDLHQQRFQHAIAELPNPIALRKKRRFIACLMTLLKERA